MKALTLWRPWPAAIIYAGKRVENRDWPPPRSLLGQDFALHAGKRVDDYEPAIDAALLPGPTGIVAVVRLAGYVSEAGDLRVRVGIDEARAREIVASHWYVGSVGWVLDNIRPLVESVECKGAQALWTVPADVEAMVRARIGEAVA